MNPIDSTFNSLLISLLILALAVMWLAIPFILMSINNKLKTLVDLQKAKNPKPDSEKNENVGVDGIHW